METEKSNPPFVEKTAAPVASISLTAKPVHRRRRLLMVVGVLLLFFGIPWLPVRIEVLNYDPDKLPLFAGLSVTPTVDLQSPPTGPNAGQFLQAPEQANPAAIPTP